MRALLPPPPDAIREWLAYDATTGLFQWKQRPRGYKAKGSDAGGVTGTGYVSISFQGVRYQAHRIAWWVMHGGWPEEIDHINMVKTDNRLANLRPATSSRNKCNRRYGHGITGYKGTAMSGTKDKPFRAYISPAGRYKHLGHFHTPDEAAEAYDKAARAAYGEYARCNFEEEAK